MPSFNPAPESKAKQCALVLSLLKKGPQTTLDLRSASVMSPAARVMDLRKGGAPIETVRSRQFDEQGKSHALALYVLLPEVAS